MTKLTAAEIAALAAIQAGASVGLSTTAQRVQELLTYARLGRAFPVAQWAIRNLWPEYEATLADESQRRARALLDCSREIARQTWPEHAALVWPAAQKPAHQATD